MHFDNLLGFPRTCGLRNGKTDNGAPIRESIASAIQSSSKKEKTGLVVHFDSSKGYDIFSVQSGKVRAGIAPESIVKLDVRVKALEMDKIYA